MSDPTHDQDQQQDEQLEDAPAAGVLDEDLDDPPEPSEPG
jgi:hypothetical protein